MNNNNKVLELLGPLPPPRPHPSPGYDQGNAPFRVTEGNLQTAECSELCSPGAEVSSKPLHPPLPFTRRTAAEHTPGSSLEMAPNQGLCLPSTTATVQGLGEPGSGGQGTWESRTEAAAGQTGWRCLPACLPSSHPGTWTHMSHSRQHSCLVTWEQCLLTAHERLCLRPG